MDKIAIVGDSDTVLGFRLAGIAESRACGKENAEEAVNAVMDKPGIGIIIVSQDLVEALSHKTRRRLEESTKPVAVIIPSKTTKEPSGSANLAAMVKRAIGVDIGNK